MMAAKKKASRVLKFIAPADLEPPTDPNIHKEPPIAKRRKKKSR